jgi:hypothetical protein
VAGMTNSSRPAWLGSSSMHSECQSVRNGQRYSAARPLGCICSAAGVEVGAIRSFADV